MKTIIAGGRNITDWGGIFSRAIVSCPWRITSVVSGGAPGVDEMGSSYAEQFGLPLEIHPADWGSHGRAAGPIRNRLMAGIAEALLAIWDGESPGTKNMIQEAYKRKLAVYVYLSHEPKCSICREPQMWCPSGLYCINEHGGAPSL